jgi:hypothetical protein
MPRTRKTKDKTPDSYVDAVIQDQEELDALTALGSAEVEAGLPQPEEPQAPVPFKPVDLPLGGRTFTIAPIAGRGGVRAYDDSADFAVEAMPLISRLFSLAMAGQMEIAMGDPGKPEVVVAELVENLGEQDMIGLVREMRARLPYLAMIACRGTDDAITEDQVKELAGSPLNPELTNIVFTQIMADRLLETMLGLGAGFGIKGV